MERTRSRRRPVGAAPGARAAVAVLAAAILAGACSRQAPSFELLLARIDSDPASADPSPFLGAARLAGSSIDALRLMKRAASRDPVLAAVVADALAAAGISSEPFALAAFGAYMEAERPESAYALFDGPLDGTRRPLLLAESYAACLAAGFRPSASTAALVAAADASGIPEFLVEAAVLAMAAGDGPAAATLLRDAVGRGAAGDPRLLWDAGVFDSMGAPAPGGDDPEPLHLAADAAWMRGEQALACSSPEEVTSLVAGWHG